MITMALILAALACVAYRLERPQSRALVWTHRGVLALLALMVGHTTMNIAM